MTKLVEAEAFIPLHSKTSDSRTIAFSHIESNADSLVSYHGLRRDFHLLKAVVLVKVLDILGALAGKLFAIFSVADDPFAFLYINLGFQIAAADVMIAGESNFFN